MFIHGYTPCLPLLILTLLPLINAQLTTLPQCIQTCITSQSSCTLTSIYCLCQASNSFTSFLPDLMSCVHSSCSSNLDPNLLLTPLQLACQIDGEPIPASILSAAQNQGGGGGIVTATVTMSSAGGGEGGETTTVTSLETQTSTERISTTGTPVVIITTNSAGSTYTHSVSDPGTSSGVRTNPVPITIISGTSTSIDSTIGGGKTSTTTTSTSAVKQTETETGTSSSSTLRSSASVKSSSKTSTSTSSGSKQTDSAPFTDTNSGVVKLGCGNFWIWMGLLGGMGMMWIW